MDRPGILTELERLGVPFVLHRHEPTHSEEERRSLPFDPERRVKTLAFEFASGLALVALREQDRLDYAKLAAALGVARASLRPAPHARIGVEPGGLAPIPRDGADCLFDERAARLGGPVFVGGGEPSATLEVDVDALLALPGTRIADLARLRAEP